ncbi:MAG: AAA family ATPase, partial [Polyangiaceae bacterium]|nr:AAA family ATPase [Polyangiaceae bacterium]
MKTNDPIAVARGLPQGAVFHRCALQVNPHDYATNFRGVASSGDAAAHARAIVEKAVALGISVLAITDHNSVSAVPEFRKAAEGQDLVVFPGFELSSSEGIHVLCIYPPATDETRLGRFLGEFGITNTDPSTDLANQAFVEVLAKVQEQGGIAVAAHVTNDKGLFQALSGQARIRTWQSEALLAIQIPGPIEDLPHDTLQIVRNRNPQYARAHAPEEDLAIAVINARDVVKADDLEDRSATCWIKMSEVSIEGLRQAFLDPASRIRLNPKTGSLEPEEHAELVALAWEGGFLDGAAVHFNPNLNVLVGGRGTGKSTVIESIRAVLALEPVGDEARKAHDGIVRQVLKSGTKISLLVRAHRPAIREYRIERTIPNPPLVKDNGGEVSNLLPQDVLPRIEVFGQHEISELTKSREKLTRLLDRFVERDDALPRRKADLKRDLEKNRRSLLDARAELKQIEERLGALPGLEETMKRFREAGLEERLKEQSLLVREERLLASLPDRLAPLRECLEALKRE